MEAHRPTIKGIFVNSHIKALRDDMGEEAVTELEKRFGRSINFKNSDDILVSDEVKIIEFCLDLQGNKIADKDREFEAGKLHFRNFSTTPLARIIFSLFKKNFKIMMLNSNKIAGHVFRGVKFTTDELSSNSVKVTMENNDYPIDHFRGLFSEWMSFAGLTGEIRASETSNGAYEYTMTWNE